MTTRKEWFYFGVERNRSRYESTYTGWLQKQYDLPLWIAKEIAVAPYNMYIADLVHFYINIGFQPIDAYALAKGECSDKQISGIYNRHPNKETCIMIIKKKCQFRNDDIPPCDWLNEEHWTEAEKKAITNAKATAKTSADAMSKEKTATKARVRAHNKAKKANDDGKARKSYAKTTQACVQFRV